MSISALTKSRETLLRLDVFGPEHTNPDGTIISGNHLHIFKDKLEMKEVIEFNINDKNLIDITLDFLNKFNVINPKVERKELEVN